MEAQSLTLVSAEQNIAATALFLATKAEENCRKTKEIVIAVAKVAQKNASLIIDEQSKEYWRWRDSILLYEELMLEVLTFDVVLQSPYNSLYHFLQKLQIEENKPLRNAAWAFLNDSFLTPMCLLVPPKDIAIAAIYFSARYTHTQIRDDVNGFPWWELLGGTPDMIARAVGVINEFYSENPLKRSENPYGQSPASAANEDALERTRSGHDTFRGDTPASQDRSQSQHTQNGHQELDNGTPVANGVTPAHENTPPAAEVVSTTIVDGSSDKLLKEAANDPATHESIENGKGTSELAPPDASSKSTPKRKEREAAEGPDPKKQKTDSADIPKRVSLEKIAGIPRNTTQEAEESEEGELEE
jgi:protein BUR2